MITVFSPTIPISITVLPNGDKDYTFNVENDKVTDSYHTMAELYDHRRELTKLFFNAIYRNGESQNVWKCKKHFDGTMFDGYFMVGYNSPVGQITYHYELKYWDDFIMSAYETSPYEYDGHDSKEVIKRMEKIR